MNNQIPAVKVLLEHGANVEDSSLDGSTTLNMAIINAYYDMASVLLDLGANPERSGSQRNTVALAGVDAQARHVLGSRSHGHGSDYGSARQSDRRMTALQLAKKLLEKGADPNARIAWKEMPMTKGLGTTKNPPNINLGRHYLSFVGSTPFYNAARNGDPAMMKLLVEHGADPKIATAVGVTPLMAAACLDYYEGETPGPLTGVSEAERLEAVKLALELGTISTPRRIWATIR